MRNCVTTRLFLYNLCFLEEIYEDKYENENVKQNEGTIFK